MMFVDPDAVVPELFRELQQIQVIVVDLIGLAGIEQARVDINPHAAILGGEIVWQIGPGHQVKPMEFHRFSSYAVAHGES